MAGAVRLLAVPQDCLALPADLALQLHNTVEQSLGTRGAAGHIKVDRDNAVTSTHLSLIHI